MNHSRLILAGLLCTGCLVMTSAQEVHLNIPRPQDAPEPSTPGSGMPAPAAAMAAPEFTDDQIIESWGWFIGQRLRLNEIGLTKNQFDLLGKGILESAAGMAPPCDPQKIGPQLDAFFRKKQAAFRARICDENLIQSKAFFAKLKENKNVAELPSGLRYEIVTPGTGPFPTAANIVKVNYTGRLLNGTVFDSSAQHGTPMETSLSRVIPGWTEGLQKINQGGKIRLYVPANLAYGETGRPGIPPGSALVFDIELMEVKPPPPPPVARPAPVATPAPATPQTPAAPAPPKH